MDWTFEQGPLPTMQTYSRDMGILGFATLMMASDADGNATAWILDISGTTIARYPMPLTFGQVRILAEGRILSEFTRALDGLFNPHDTESDA